MELWDAYKADGTLAGSTLIRGEEIPEGLCHAVAEVFVMHEDGTILLMQRDKNKPHYPGYWESSAGGAVRKGESFEHGARRELLEETGILAGELEPIYKVFTPHTIYRGYLCKTNIEKNSILLQQGETIDYKWVSQHEFTDFFESDEFSDSLRERLNTFVKNNFVTEKDCCFSRDKFWFRYRVGAIIIEDGCILMVKNDADDYYYSIGGGVHMGETSEEAVVREVREETGMNYEIDRMAFVNESLFHGDGSLCGRECHVIEFYYLMKPKGRKDVESNVSNGTAFGGIPEYLHWIAIAELESVKEFPLFFREKLLNLPETIEHIVSDERN